MEIREYQPKDEIGWVRCRVLSLLDTAYFDNVLKGREKYEDFIDDGLNEVHLDSGRLP